MFNLNFLIKKSIYALAAFVFIYYLAINYNGMQSTITPFAILAIIALISPDYEVKNKKKLIIASIIGGIILGAANYDSFDLLMIGMISGVVLVYGCLEFVQGFSFDGLEVDKKWVYWLVFGALAGTFLLFLAFNLPGILTIDGEMSFKQIEAGVIKNTHPYLYTLMLTPFVQAKEGFTVYCVLQSLIMAGTLTYAVATVKRPLLALVFIIIPFHMVWANSFAKDTLFACMCLLFVISLYRAIHQNDWLTYTLLPIGLMGMCIFRLNGSFMVLFTSVLVAFIIRNKKLTVFCFSFLGAAYFLKYGIPAMVSIHGSDIAESTTLMQQQIANALMVEKGELVDKADKFLPVGEWKSHYEPNYGDSIKYLIRNNGYIQQHSNEFFKLWWDLGLKHPDRYLQAFIDNSRFYYNGAYVNDWRFWTVYNLDHPGVGAMYKGLFEPTSKSFPYLDFFLSIDIFKAVGFHTWILLAMWFKGNINKAKERVICYPFIALLITNIFLAPVPEYRYMYPMFLALPFIIVILLKKNDSYFPLQQYIL